MQSDSVQNFKQLIRNLRTCSCIACGKFMAKYRVEHKTFGNVTLPCHEMCTPTEEQIETGFYI